VRSDLAIGICYPNAGSAVQWHVDGQPVLDKVCGLDTRSRDLIILPAGCEFVGRCCGSGQGLWLFISPQSLDPKSRIREFAQKPRVDCSWARDRWAWMIATQLRNECLKDFPRGPLFLESASMALVAQLAYLLDKAAPTNVEAIRPLRGPKLQMVLEYIDSNLEHNITLTELAGLVQLTPRYFCEVFKRAMGRPPHQFQIERRIERAKCLLKQTSVTLSELALKVGFSSQSHLNLYFRRIVGITPARYRASLFPSRNPGERDPL